MNQDKCAECGEPTVYEEELGSAVCTSCGTLSNPSQNILASHLDRVDTSGYEYNSHVNTTQGSTLKGRNGRALAGQDKDARDRRNTISMHEFIRTLAGRLSAAGVANRGQAVFDQAMAKGNFRWGRPAKLLAGASLAIALRGANKGDSLRDLAYLLEEPLTSLSKTFKTVISLLQLKINSADPAQHLPVLQTHLRSIIKGSTSVPQQLSSVLSPLEHSTHTIQQTATSLSHVVSRVPSLACLPAASTACAILILSVEGELTASLPQAGTLAQALGTRVGASKTIVMQRYKAVYDLVEEYIRDVPWLQSHEPKGKGRSKVAKRTIVARGLKDVVQFREELWRKKLENEGWPVLDIEVDSNDGDDNESVATSEHSHGMSVMPNQRVASREDDSAPQPKKARKHEHSHAVERTSQFLLHPLAQPSRSSASSSGGTQGASSLLEHLFTIDESSLSHAFVQPPTRLQLLASSRGGEAIDDEELFEEGEMEALLRTSVEVDALRPTLIREWGIADDEDQGPRTPPRSHKKRKREDETTAPSASSNQRTKRVNMDALARLLDPDTHLDEMDEEGGFDALAFGLDQEEHGAEEEAQVPFEFPPGDEEEVGEWRPLSPGGGGFDEDRYDV